jgi:hypothetical protein
MDLTWIVFIGGGKVLISARMKRAVPKSRFHKKFESMCEQEDCKSSLWALKSLMIDFEIDHTGSQKDIRMALAQLHREISRDCPPKIAMQTPKTLEVAAQ